MYSHKTMTIRGCWKVERVDGVQGDQSDIILPVTLVGTRPNTLHGAKSRGDVWEVYHDPDEDGTVFVLTFSRQGIETCGVTEFELDPIAGWREVYERSYFAQEHHVSEMLGGEESDLANTTIFRRLLEFAHDRY